MGDWLLYISMGILGCTITRFVLYFGLLKILQILPCIALTARLVYCANMYYICIFLFWHQSMMRYLYCIQRHSTILSILPVLVKVSQTEFSMDVWCHFCCYWSNFFSAVRMPLWFWDFGPCPTRALEHICLYTIAWSLKVLQYCSLSIKSTWTLFTLKQ